MALRARKKVLDSYTGDEYVESYQSSIPNIMKGIPHFYRDEYACPGVVYEISPGPDESWLLSRRHTAASPALPFMSLPRFFLAERAVLWLIDNEPQTSRTFAAFYRGDVLQLVGLVQHITLHTYGPQPQRRKERELPF